MAILKIKTEDGTTNTIKQTNAEPFVVAHKPVYEFFKRIVDIIISFVGIIVLSPIFIVLAVLVKAASKGPVIYKHKRVGKNGKAIYIYKFRSMVVNADKLIESFTPEQKEEFQKNFKLDNDPRVTGIGKILRKTSLDELPQLLNILKGDISIVGPRPITEAEADLYGDYKSALLSVKPGLTGFWASSGRSDISYEKRRDMEMYYVKNRNFWFDIKIFFKTFISVFRGLGAK